MKKRIIMLLAEVFIVMSMFGCGTPKFNVDAGSGYELAKKSYAAGEEVTAYYPYIATDTDYTFYVEEEDVEYKTSYDNEHGYVLTFTMPAHDVKLGVKSRNSMEMDYNAIVNPETDENEGGNGELGENEWLCPECGQVNEGKFCSSCGSRKPE